MLRPPFQIVIGTHDVTPVPTAARAFGLHHRFALVQSTHHPASADMVVEPTALLAVLTSLDQAHDALGVLYWDHTQRRKLTRLELAQHYLTNRDPEREVVAAGEWRRDREPTVLLATESWSHVGGPAPYHDSLTYSFYSATDLSASLLAALRAAGLAPTAIHTVPPSADQPRPAPATPAWARRGFGMALTILLLAAVLTISGELLEISPALDALIARISWWFAVPTGVSLIYALVYVVRKLRHPGNDLFAL